MGNIAPNREFSLFGCRLVHFMSCLFFSRNRSGQHRVQQLLQVSGSFSWQGCLNRCIVTYSFFLVLNGFLNFIFCVYLCQDVSFINQSKCVLNLSELLSACVSENFIYCIEGLVEVLLFAKTLSFKDLSFYISWLSVLSWKFIVVSPLKILGFVESVNCIIEVVLSHESLC